MMRKIRNMIKIVRITASPGYAQEVSSNYWRQQTVSLEELTEEERGTYFANLDAVLSPEDGEALLDYGCGAGEKSAYLAEQGYDVTGADISESLMAVARSRGVDCYLVEDLRQAGRKFDRVFMHGVFMYVHPKERSEFLRRVRDLLAPGGTLFLLGEPDIGKRGHGPRNPLQVKLAPWLPVYQFFNASFWTEPEALRSIAEEAGYVRFEKQDGPPTISAPDRSHFVLGC